MSTDSKRGWRTSSYSGSGDNNCVEVNDDSFEAVQIRDTKDRSIPSISAAPAAWAAFTAFAGQQQV
ncbi:DUF397 domain-containing protein [Streptomyces sp. NPDC001941]|uniref:DUF397 domain-containing protein n=1 Tax=Streptomyces sp. NPDC001941 TaxID=3154659 RepID=UPI003317685C